MTCGYYRTSSPVTALPMIIRWISDVPSKIVKLVAVREQFPQVDGLQNTGLSAPTQYQFAAPKGRSVTTGHGAGRSRARSRDLGIRVVNATGRLD
jgi:hypothetical protein